MHTHLRLLHYCCLYQNTFWKFPSQGSQFKCHFFQATILGKLSPNAITLLSFPPEQVTLFKYCCCWSVAKSCLTLCDPVNCSPPGFPLLHYLPEFAQTHVHWVGDSIQPSHSLSPPSPPTLSLSQHQGLLQWIGSSHQMAKLLELQHQSFQWIFRVDFLDCLTVKQNLPGHTLLSI